MSTPLSVPDPKALATVRTNAAALAAPVLVPLPGGRPPAGGGGIGVASARIAVMMLLATETMLFTALLGSYVFLRYGSAVAWPPPGQPRLPLGVTIANSIALLVSAYTYNRGLRAIRRGEVERLKNALAVTVVLGSTFLLVQGSEWFRLIRHGLTLQSSLYGATFYMLIGLHAMHVIAGVLWLFYVIAQARRDRYSGARYLGVELAGMYWYYVCALWVVLFGVVYL